MQVLNKGYVNLIDFMGNDSSVIRNARMCYDSQHKKNADADKNLIEHLLKNKHMTPFESIVFTFDVKCPIFVSRQWIRHRIGSFQERSLRYCKALEYYTPDGIPEKEKIIFENANIQAFEMYEQLINEGMKKELARSVLPLGTYTNFIWIVNGSSLINFLRLRLDKTAQKEIREYAKIIFELAKNIAPMTFSAFECTQLTPTK